jgi:uncharacterized membrane protein
LKNSASENMYSVAFHYCNLSPIQVGSVDMRLEVVEMNPGPEFLGAGLSPIPNVYLFMSMIFGFTAIIWGWTLFAHRDSTKLFKVHWLMMALIVVKTFSSLFHGIDYKFISATGSRNEGWAITYYILAMAKGLILFLAILLIGVGYGFVKHALSKNERNVFMLVIPLQVISNIAGIVIEESAEGSAAGSNWRSIGLLVDLICCGAILFPVVWSIRHLREASESDGKAAAALSKLRIFRRFYVMVLAYIYTTRIIVYLVESTIPFRYEYVGPFFDEMVAYVFYVSTGTMFSPEDDNEYLIVPPDSEDEWDGNEEEEVLVSSMGEGLTKRGGKASAPYKPPPAAPTAVVIANGAFEPDF